MALILLNKMPKQFFWDLYYICLDNNSFVFCAYNILYKWLNYILDITIQRTKDMIFVIIKKMLKKQKKIVKKTLKSDIE